MAKVTWSIQARKDLEKITDYYTEASARFAETLAQDVLSKTKRLEIFPLAGRIVPEIKEPSIRELVHRNYRIIYLHNADEDDVEILTVFHSARQFGGLPENPEG